jgi:hypothetical protein
VRKSLFWTAVLGILFIVNSSNLLAQDKPILAVMDIQDRNNILDDMLMDNLTEYLRGLLTESGNYIVIDRGRQAQAVKKVVKKAKKDSYKTCYDRSCQVPLGKALAADKIVITSIMKIGSRFILKAEIIDLASEASEEGATAKADASPLEGQEDRIARALDEIVEKLCAKNSHPQTSGVKIPDGPPPDTVQSVPQSEQLSETDRLELEATREATEWKKLRKVAQNNRLPLDQRLNAITNYRKRLTWQSPYDKKATQLIARLTRSPAYYRSKTEWVSIEFLASNYGFGFRFAAFVLRWERFYFECLQFSWQLWPDKREQTRNPYSEEVGDGFYKETTITSDSSSYSLGFGLGYPLFLGKNSRHEIRFGTDIDLLIGFHEYLEKSTYSNLEMYVVNSDEKEKDFMGLGITPYLRYVYHVAPHFSFRAGLEAMLPVVPYSGDDYQATFGGNAGFGF